MFDLFNTPLDFGNDFGMMGGYQPEPDFCMDMCASMDLHTSPDTIQEQDAIHQQHHRFTQEVVEEQFWEAQRQFQRDQHQQFIDQQQRNAYR